MHLGMKKIGSIIVCALLLVALSSFAAAKEVPTGEDVLLEEQFAPYQEVLDELNEKYQTTVQVADPENKEQAYRNAIELGVDEFRRQIEDYILDMQELSELENEEGVIDAMDPEISEDVGHFPSYTGVNEKVGLASGISPRGMTLPKTQTYYLSRGGSIILKSTAAWNPGLRYTAYASITGVSGGTSSDGRKYNISSYNTSLSSDKRYCYVSTKGSHVDANGFSDLVVRYYNVTFCAGEG